MTSRYQQLNFATKESFSSQMISGDFSESTPEAAATYVFIVNAVAKILLCIRNFAVRVYRIQRKEDQSAGYDVDDLRQSADLKFSTTLTESSRPYKFTFVRMLLSGLE